MLTHHTAGVNKNLIMLRSRLLLITAFVITIQSLDLATIVCCFCFAITTPCACRFKRYISSHGASIQKTKLFLERESNRLVERQAALQEAQASSSEVANQEGGLAEDIVRNLQQVRDGQDSSPANRKESLLSLGLILTSCYFPFLVSGGQDLDGATADSSERKLPPAEKRGATAGAHKHCG